VKAVNEPRAIQIKPSIFQEEPMRMTHFTRRRFVVRAAIQVALIAPLSISLSLNSTFAQDRNGNKPNQRGVPATPASSTKSLQNNPEAGPTIVATVNGNPISLSDLAAQCRVRFGDQVLEDMVNKTLILQACQAQKIVISSKDIDDEIARTASKFNLSMASYLKLIEDERQISPEQYASDIIWPMLALRALSKDKIVVSPQEIDQAFQSQFGPKVQVRMIACKDPQKLAQLVQQATAKPASFKTLARDHSEDAQSASVEGLLPPIRKFSGDDELETIAFNLQPDQISKVFPAGEMHVVLQCVKHLPPSNPPGAQMQEIQARLKSEIEDTKLRGTAESVYSTLRTSSEVVLVLGKKELEAQYPGVAAIANRQSIPVVEFEKTIVRRHGLQVLDGEINRKLIEDALTKAGAQITQADITAEINRAADYYGFVNNDGSPNLDAWMKHVLNEDDTTEQLYIRDSIWPTVALKKLVQGQVNIGEEDVRKGFESNYGPRAEVLAIVLSNQRTAQSVWEMARGNPSEQYFGELANQYSVEDSSRSNSGKVPPLRRFGGSPNLEKAAFDLKPGDLSGIIEVGGQFVILKSQGYTTPIVTDFNAVKDEIYKDILEKKMRVAMESHLSKLLADAQIANFLSVKKSKAGRLETQAALETLKQETSKR
jgi:parvulin-like peptidyl-prolyl isomerase